MVTASGGSGATVSGQYNHACTMLTTHTHTHTHTHIHTHAHTCQEPQSITSRRNAPDLRGKRTVIKNTPPVAGGKWGMEMPPFCSAPKNVEQKLLSEVKIVT